MAEKPSPDKEIVSIPGDAASIPTTIKNRERIASRRNELIEIATNMFLDRGFHNTSVRQIVRACSFNLASLYMYVSSKEDILYLVAQDLMSTIANELLETKIDPDSPEQAIRTGFQNYCRISNKFRRQIRLLYREVGFFPKETRSDVLSTVSNVLEFFERIVEQGIAAGVFRDLPPKFVALDMMTAAHSIALHPRDVLSQKGLNDYISYQTDKFLTLLLVGERRVA
jgi:AcrR family transcriptional regulator